MLSLIFLSAFAARDIKHGAKVEATLTEKQGEVFADVSALQVPEAFGIEPKHGDYTLVVNYEATKNVTLFVCAFDSVEKCGTARKRVFMNQSGVFVVEGFARQLKLTQDAPVVYLLFIATEPDVSVTFQAASEILLQPFNVNATLAPAQGAYFMAMKCADAKETLLEINDTTAELCWSTSEPRETTACANKLSGSKQYTVPLTGLYLYVTVLPRASVDVALKFVIVPEEFATNKTNSLQLQKHRLCHSYHKVKFQTETTFCTTQEIQETGITDKVLTLLVTPDTIHPIYEKVDLLTATDVTTITSSVISHPVMPWHTDFTIPDIAVWMVFAPQLLQAVEDRFGAVEANYVIKNTKQTLPYDGIKRAPYEIALLAEKNTFQVTDKYGDLGDTCTSVDSYCQLAITDKGQIKLDQERLYYATFPFIGGNFAFAPVFQVQPDHVITDRVKSFERRYFKMPVAKAGQLAVRSNQPDATVEIVLSNKLYLPDKSQSAYLLQASAKQNVTLEVPDAYLEGGKDLYFSVSSEYDMEVQFSFVSGGKDFELVSDEIITEIQFEADKPKILVAKIPEKDNFNMSFYSQVVFQASAYKLPEGCKISFSFMANTAIEIAQLNAQALFASIPHHLDSLNIVDFVMLSAKASCTVSAKMLAVNVLRQIPMNQVQMPTQKHSVSVVANFKRGMDIRLELIGADAKGVVYACPQPVTILGSQTEKNCQVFSLETYRPTEMPIEVLFSARHFESKLGLVYFTLDSDLDPAAEKPLTIRATEVIQLSMPQSLLLQPRQRIFYFAEQPAQARVLYIQVDQVVTDSVEICVSTMYEICTEKITQKGIYRMDNADFAGKSLHIYVSNLEEDQQPLKFEAYFSVQVENVAGNIFPLALKANVPVPLNYKLLQGKAELFTVAPKGNSAAVRLQMLVSEGILPTIAAHNTFQSRIGSLSVLLQPTTPTTNPVEFQMIVVSPVDVQVEISATFDSPAVSIEQGKFLAVKESSEVMLRADYSPAGVLVELCTDQKNMLESALFSLEGPPSATGTGVAMKMNKTVNGQFKAIFNSSVHQNVFMQMKAKAPFNVFNAFVDPRPQIPNTKIRVVESTAGGQITVQIQPADYVGDVTYAAFLLDIAGDQLQNPPACAMRNGHQVSDIYSRTKEGDISIQLARALTSNKQLMSVIVFDVNEPTLQSVYETLTVYAGMPVSGEDDPDQPAKDLTWVVILSVAGVLVVAGAVFALYFFRKKRLEKMEHTAEQKKKDPYTGRFEEEPFIVDNETPQ